MKRVPQKLLFYIFLLCFITSLPATNYYVTKSGNDRNNGQSPAQAWLTIDKAMDHSYSGGDTLFIGSGDYWEYMPMSSAGSSGQPFVIYGDVTGKKTGQPAGSVGIGDSNKNYAIEIKDKNDIHIHGITFQGPKKSCVYISGSDNIEISHCTMKWQSQYGIFTYKAGGYLRFTDNTITDGTYSIYLYYSDDSALADILSNTITNSTIGIYCHTTDIDSIAYNSISGINNYGIYVRYATPCNTICHNDVYNIWNSYGIYVYRTNCPSVVNNVIYNIQKIGIYAYGSSGYSIGSISNNVIHDIWSDTGIYAKYYDVDRISNNTIYTFQNRGIYVHGNNSYTVSAIDSNYIHNGWKEGIYVFRTKNVSSIIHNHIHNVDIGIHWNPSSYYEVMSFSNNVVHSNYTGGMLIKYIDNTTINNNLIYGNPYWDGYGIWINNDNNRTVHLKNNTIYNPGDYGIYGRNVNGTWCNNIIVGSNNYGIYGNNTFDITDSYNCVWDNVNNWAGNASSGIGSFSQDPLFVDPDGADNTLGGSNWEDDDLHIQSTGSSWHFGAWLPDAADSPCLDTGDPNDDFTNEPEDNGDRINIGYFGNTAEASRIGSSCPITETFAAFPDSSWMLVGVPIIPEDGDPFAVYGDDFGGEMPNGTNWACYRWTTEDSVAEYYEYGDGTDLQPPDCYPGIGHYMWQNTGNPVAVDVVGCPLDEDAVLDVAKAPTVNWEPHPPGYNIFANPFTFTIDWSNSSIIKYSEGRNSSTEYTLDKAASEGIISRYAYTYNYFNGEYEIVTPSTATDDTISVWQGFWFVQLDSVNDIELVIPHTRALGKTSSLSKELSSSSSKHNYRTASVASGWDWFLKLGVIAPDKKVQDVSNGIGIAESASDATDSWDALDFKSTDFNGNFVQMQFINSDEKLHAYDIHAPFTESSDWKIRVTAMADNVGKLFSFVWPEMRLVPETVKFTLYNSDKTEVLIPNLRNASIPYYDFSYTEGENYFTIEATHVNDTKIPEFSFIVTQNPYAPQDATVYAVPSEPVLNISATLDGSNASLNELQSPPYVYYHKVQIEGTSAIQFAISASDASGNSGTGSATLNSALAKPTESLTITDSNSRISLEIPPDAISKITPMILTCCKMDLDYDIKLTPVSKSIYIGPRNTYFNKPVTLKIPVDDSESSLYYYNGKTWEYVSDFSSSLKLYKTGIYQLFAKPISEPVNAVVPDRFKLYSTYPNPFNNSTLIRYDIQKTSDVSIMIYDLQGREVRNLTQKYQMPGSYSIPWNGKNNLGKYVSSGNYIVRFLAKNGKSTLYKRSQKITLVK